jgi:hypothetical protein
MQFELTLENQEIPDFDKLLEFIEKRSHTLEAISRNAQSKPNSLNKTLPINYAQRSKGLIAQSQSNNNCCIVCKDSSHNIYKCSKFEKMNFEERLKIVRRNKLCLNCLHGSHFQSNCKSKIKCGLCQQNHNTLLHRSREIIAPTQIQDESKAKDSDVGSVAATTASSVLFTPGNSKLVLINTAVVYLRDSQGNKIAMRAILDSAAQSNFITHEAANALGIKKQKVNVPICGLNDGVFTCKSQLSSQLSNANDECKWHLDFLIVPKITDVTPSRYLNVSKLNVPKHVCLADPEFHKPGRIQLLLGAELFFDFLRTDKIRLDDNKLLLQESCFGYLVSGSTSNNKSDASVNHCFLVKGLENLDRTLTSFWELENVETETCISDELKYCNEHFEKTHYRNADGRYVVKMPFKPQCSEGMLGNSREVASNRLDRLEKRLERDHNMKTLYSEFLNEYERLGHMEEINVDMNIDDGYYLPHHGVLRPDSQTTKLRVVFDASAKTTNGKSLNDILSKGGVIQDDLFSILLRFRKHAYAFSADIEKMFRQILIDPSQTHLQRILWKASKGEQTRIYDLKTVTYGTASAPYLATRTLHQLALDEKQSFPLAAAVVLSDFYMDDCLSGSSDLSQAKLIQTELTQLLSRGGMTLHKWFSNHPDLQIGEFKTYPFEISSEESSVKTLGMQWKTESDTFVYRVYVNPSETFTKRSVLSVIARLYDPLGLIGPVISKAKIFLQRLWLLKLDWHTNLPQAFSQEWLEFTNSLHLLENLKIPRYVLTEDIRTVIMHGFADASESAYGAVIYLKSISRSGSVSCQLLCSKSRVAPIKTVTVPRLELSACLLLARLVQKTLTALKLKIDQVLLWSDSTIALAWIKKSPHLLKTFVGNRVSQIQRLCEAYHWGHVSSECNPADIISRGLDAETITTNQMWWHGPGWLLSEEIEFPDLSQDNITDTLYLKELKPTSELTLTAVKPDGFFDNFMNCTNSYSKLIKIVSYIFRFIENCRGERKTGPLTPKELEHAEETLIKLVQLSNFRKEIVLLQEGKNVNNDSKLKHLNPFLDSKGIIRVGGRLANSSLRYNHKFPYVLPKNHKLTKLIFQSYHLKYLHIGAQGLLNQVRMKFWVINGRSLARMVVHECIVCFKNRPTNYEQIMGNLPSQRVNPDFVFNACGLDFCGPFLIKYKNQRKGIYSKVYVAIFICLATKAIHLEIVTDLTTDALIATIKRFISRRGKCNTLMSDNGSNMIGAKSELKRLNNLINKPDSTIANFLASEGINWKLIPPRSPNFGGLWEAGVKSFKHHLKRTVGNHKLTIDEFWTIVSQIEGILNSRPILPLSSDANDFQALTPGHFLIGRAITSLPEPDLSHISDNRLSRWQLMTKFVQTVWKRWRTDYLSHLQQRTKWKFRTGNVSKDMLVLIKDDNLPPCRWSLARIVEVIPGKDNQIRVVRVKTANGVFIRGVSKLCILPIKDNYSVEL